MQKAKLKTFKNGLRVVTIPMKDNPTVTVLVLVGAGSDYETKNINGISHFLEHMCFKGTQKRPSSRIISHELDALGCQYNAFTSHEFTGYYAKGDAKHFSKIFDIVTDIYLNPTLPEVEMEKEKGVIIEEMNMYEDIPQAQVQDLLAETLYGDQPAGWKIVGPKENIKNMKREDFIKYRKTHYLASNTVIVVSGQVTKEKVYKEAKKYLEDFKTIKSSKKEKVKQVQVKPNISLKYKATDQTHFALGMRSFPLGDKRNSAILVLSAVLGMGMSSRLFIKLREEMGVAYYVKAVNEPSKYYGIFQIIAGVNNSRVKEVLKEIISECRILTEELVSKKELDKVKSYLIGNTKLSLEATDDIANFYGAQELLVDDMKTLAEKIKGIKKVTALDVRNVAKLIFKNKKLNLSLIGPIKDKKSLNKIISF